MYFSIFNLYDKIGAGENLFLNLSHVLLLTCGHNKIYLLNFRSSYSLTVRGGDSLYGEEVLLVSELGSVRRPS